MESDKTSLTTDGSHAEIIVPLLSCEVNKKNQGNEEEENLPTLKFRNIFDDCLNKINNNSALEEHNYHNKKDIVDEKMLIELKQLGCDICSDLFPSKELLQKHILVHVGKNPYICDVCSVGFSSKEILQKHVLVHVGEKPYRCVVCNARFKECANLHNHSITHGPDKLTNCDICIPRKLSFLTNFED